MTQGPVCKSVHDTYRTLCHLLDNNKKVYYSRFGDGDMYILGGKNQANHQHNAQLEQEMRQSISIDDPLYLRGHVINYPIEKEMTKGLFLHFKLNDEMANLMVDKLAFEETQVLENSWFPNFYASFRPAEMRNFLERYVRPRRKMFIGSVPREEVEKLFGEIHHYIQIPRKNAYGVMNEWWPGLMEKIDDVELVLPAAGMSSRIIAKRLWESGKEIHCLDLGSLVDAVSSFPTSRTWIRLKGHMVNRILPAEYQDNSPAYWIGYGLRETKLFFRKQYYRWDPFANTPLFRKARIYHPGPGKQFN